MCGSNESVQVTPKPRLAKYALSLSSEKTWPVDFRRPDRRAVASSFNDSDAGLRLARSTCWASPIYWTNSNNGYWVVKRKDALPAFDGLEVWIDCGPLFGVRSSAPRTGAGVTGTCPVLEQWAALRQKVSGRFGYFAVIGQLAGALPLSPPCRLRVAQMVKSPLAAGRAIVGGYESDA